MSQFQQSSCGQKDVRHGLLFRPQSFCNGRTGKRIKFNQLCHDREQPRSRAVISSALSVRQTRCSLNVLRSAFLSLILILLAATTLAAQAGGGSSVAPTV